MKVPKLQESLFFQKEILGELIEQLTIGSFQQNLPFDPKILDSLESDQLVHQSISESAVINYEHIESSLHQQNWSVIIYSQLCKLSAIEQKQLSNIIDRLNIPQTISEAITGHLIIYQKLEEDPHSIIKRSYQLTKKQSQIYITPKNNQQLICLNHIDKIQIAPNLWITGRYHEHSNKLIEQLLIRQVNQKGEASYHLLTDDGSIEEQENMHSFGNIEELIRFCCYLRIQYKYYYQECLPTKTNYHRLQQPDQKYTVSLSAFKYQQVSSTSKIFIHHINALVQLLFYFHRDLKLSMGSANYALIMVQSKTVPVFIGLEDMRSTNIQLFAYDIFLLATLAIQRGIQLSKKQDKNISTSHLLGHFQQICQIADPKQVIKIFEDIKEYLKMMQPQF